MQRLLIALVALVAGCGCGSDVNVYNPTQPSPAAVVAVTKSTISFRVFGNASQVRIRYSTPLDGLTQVVTSLPYANSFSTTETSLFLSLEGTPLVYPVVLSPFLNVQIVADGVLFREATSNDFTANPLTVSGTWRR
jgi:hypothetical protein